MGTVVTFGEIMMRVAPPGFLRFRQAMPGAMDISFAGAEANVAAAVTVLGGSTEYVTALPDNAVTQACIDSLRGRGIGTNHILKNDTGRLGVYFVETGSDQRPSTVVYDRSGSAISLTEGGEYDWPKIFASSDLAGERADWFHTTGITPSLSRQASDATLEAVRAAKDQGLSVSCDLNYRSKLWRWEPGVEPKALAEREMSKILPYVDLVVANEGDASDVLGIRAEGSEVEHGRLSVERYPEVARKVVERFPNVSLVAITLRQSISASHNDWGAMLYCKDGDRFWFAPTVDGEYTPYEIRHIVDRVGAGDSFAGSMIFALRNPAFAASGSSGEIDYEKVLSFAVAGSCLAHTIKGDFNLAERSEIEALAAGFASGRVVR
jgi:2-dehydro-3-deoxygluconokinase